jgi:SAM-dependent methyltransferase
VLEIGDDTYSRRFGGTRIERQDVLHVDGNNPMATIVGDIATPGTLPAKAFDCIILTQTLQYIFDLEAAVRELYKALRPGGVLLLTVPALSPICADEWQDRHLWLFTSLVIERLLHTSFEDNKVEVSAFGNLYAATAFLHGAALEEVSYRKLLPVNPDYAITIAGRSVA